MALPMPLEPPVTRATLPAKVADDMMVEVVEVLVALLGGSSSGSLSELCPLKQQSSVFIRVRYLDGLLSADEGAEEQ